MRRRLRLTAAVTGLVAILVAGYAAAGATGLIDAASLAAAAVLIAARGLVRGEQPPPVRIKDLKIWPRRPGDATEFPGYGKIFSDLSWAQVSRRHYEHPLRPALVRLAEALGRRDELAAALAQAELAEDPGAPDAPGLDLAALDRVITSLES
jgi:hypothetical protein